MSDTIRRIHARQILDSRGNPTVEVDVHCEGGVIGRASVPSGASTGVHEAVELRDGDARHYGGKGVLRAVGHVNGEIAASLVGQSASRQAEIDRSMIERDGTPNKSRLGANAILGVSLACARAAAECRGSPLWAHIAGLARATPTLPLPMVNMISGGLHAGRQLEFQDFLFLPIAARSVAESLEQTVAVYRALSELLKKRGFEGVLVGDEGGFGPRLPSNETALEIVVESFRAAGLTPGKDAAIALDVASSHFYEGGSYKLAGRLQSSYEFAETLAAWCRQYPIVSIEDGMAEDDWAGWTSFTKKLAGSVQLIGDDFFATNLSRLERGINAGAANAILIKVNQIGTLTEALDVLQHAQKSGYRTVVSARSGETEDSFLADLAVGSAGGQIKIGSIVRSERLAKYNQLLRIEEEMGTSVRFARWETK